MSLKVVKDQSRFEYTIDGSVLIYHNLNFIQKKRLLYSHMTNGEISSEDSIELAYAVMKEMVTDWREVFDDSGEVLAFDKKHIDGLPLEAVMQFLDEIIFPQFKDFMTVKDGLIEKAQSETARREDEIKNSEPM